LSSFLDLPADLSQRLEKQSQAGTRREARGRGPVHDRFRKAAVLLPLIWRHEHWQLIYTLRSSMLHDHSGQVSFPGGSWEESDKSIIDTALRESWEEIGLDPEIVRVLGKMADVEMITGFRITPVVGICEWPTRLTVNPDEVDRVFSIPIDWLADKRNRYYREHDHQGVDFEVLYFKPYDGETVWGVTAMITLDFLKLLDIKV